MFENKEIKVVFNDVGNGSEIYFGKILSLEEGVGITIIDANDNEVYFYCLDLTNWMFSKMVYQYLQITIEKALLTDTPFDVKETHEFMLEETDLDEEYYMIGAASSDTGIFNR